MEHMPSILVVINIKFFPDGFFHGHTETIATNNYRSARWLTSHLRTFRKELFMRIKEEDFIDPVTNSYYDTAGDFTFMLPMLEMAAERQRYIPDIMYVYNKTNPISDDKKDVNGSVGSIHQERTADSIRQKTKYARLKSLNEESCYQHNLT